MGLGSVLGSMAGSIVSPIGAIAGAVAGNNAQKKLKKKKPAAPSVHDRLEADARTRGAAADSNLMGSRQQLAGFDPMAYMKQAAGAAYGELAEQDQARYAKRTAVNNSRGFLGSPVGRAADSRYFDKQLAQALAGLSMDAGRMDLARNSELFQSDRDDSQFYYGAGTDIAMSKEAQRLADKKSKRDFWGGLAKGALSAGAMALMASDEELKENIEEVAPVLERVKKVRGVKWDWNAKGKRATAGKAETTRTGVIAQELEEEFPELVTTAPEGHRQVDYGGFAATLVKAIGELDDKVESIRAGR